MPRTVWILIDGLPYWLIERWAGRGGRLDTFAGLAARGRIVPLLPASPNCQTPPSLASLFCGRPPVDTGLTGFDIPVMQQGLPTGVARAFDVGPCRPVTWVWEAASARGDKVRLCHVPFVVTERLGASLIASSYGFVTPLQGPRVVPMDAQGTTEIGIIARHRLTVDLAAGGAVLKSEPLSGGNTITNQLKINTPVDVACGDLATTVIFSHIDGRPSIAALGCWQPRLQGAQRRGDTPSPAHEALPFLGSTLSAAYRSGALGRTLHDDGNGQAERLLAAAVRALSRRYYAEALHAVGCGDAHFTLCYQPAIDLLLHELVGFIDPDCRHHSPARAAIAEPLLLSAFVDADAFLAQLARLTDTTDRVLVCSDHGMAAIDSVLRPDQALLECGIIELTSAGRIDVVRSAAFFHPAETGLVVLNSTIMAERGLSEAQLFGALCARLDGASGRCSSIFAWDGAKDCPPTWVMRHYLRPGRYCQLKAGLGVIATPSRKTGDHCVNSENPQLRGSVIDLRGNILRERAPIQTHEVAPLLMSGSIH